MSFIENARLRGIAWLRERREKAEERKAAKRATQRHGHDSRFWLLSIPATATLCAAFVEVYWAVLFCIQATGRLENDWAVAFGTGQAASGAWHFAFDIRSVPVLIGLVAATVPIVMWSMVWLPVQMKARGTGRMRRATMITAGLLANALVIVSGTVVMNSNRQEQVRAGQVVEQQAGQGRAQLQSQIDGITADLNTMFNNRNAYMAQAASVGAARWNSTYVTQARTSNDPRLPMIERALGAAQAADDARTRRDVLRTQLAAAPTQAAVAAHVNDTAGVGLDTFATYANVYRPPFVALICTIIGIFGTWWWVGLAEAMNSHNVSLSGWAPEDHRIEDHSNETPIVVETDTKGRVKMKPPRRKFTDADTGEEIEQVLIPAHHRTLKPGKKTAVEIVPAIPPDEVGTPEGLDHGDGGLRSFGLHGEHEPLAMNEGQEENAPQYEADADSGRHTSIPALSDAIERPEHQAGDAQETQNGEQGVSSGEQHSESPISDEDEAAALLAAAGEQESGYQATNADTENDRSRNEDESAEHSHPSLLQTAPQQVADLAQDEPDSEEAADYEPRSESPNEGHDEGIEQAFANGRDRAETRPERLLEVTE